MLTGSLFCSTARAQSADAPLTSQELVRLVYQLPKHPEKRDEVIAEIRRRGIGFELTEGMRGVVATKSGNDALLRRTLEEAERRRLNPTEAAAPPPAEAAQLLEQARKTILAAAGGLPDFVVKQLITRAQALGTTHNWIGLDRLTVAVSYRESAGEQYKLLAVNGVPQGGGPERDDYTEAGGASSTGDFAMRVLFLFTDESQTDFRFAATDTLRGRRTFIYDFTTAKKTARERVTTRLDDGSVQSINVGLRGRLWIDRESARVLRGEFTTTEIEPDFPIKRVDRTIDYDWVDISGQKYLLPVTSEIVFTKLAAITELDPETGKRITHKQLMQDRNLIRFRNYQKFGTEVKIIEEGDFTEEEPPKKP
ncbi:MAG TPA: hypothetical protein VF525_16900 [Pyrinomonadaceae bacterium]